MDFNSDAEGSASAEYARRLCRAFEGEVFGEVFFAGLAQRVSDPARQASLHRLAELERLMRSGLEELALRQRIDLPDGAPARTRGSAAADSFATRPWREFIDTFDEGTDAALRGYEKLRTVAPDPEESILALLIGHENALRTFGERSRAGRDDALAEIDEVVRALGAPY